MIIKRTSYFGVEREMDLDVEQWQIDHWKAGELLQNAFPKLTADEREFIKSGNSPQDWDQICGTE